MIRNVWLLSLMVLTGSMGGILGSVNSAQADNMIRYDIAGASVGAQVSGGQCPCFRMRLGVRVAGGVIDTKEVLISSDSLFQAILTSSADLQTQGTSLIQVGQVEAIIKGAHFGIAFDGVTFGSDNDRGLAEVFRTGLHAIASIIQSDPVRFGIQAGYNYEDIRTLMGLTAQRHMATAAAVLHWESGPWSGSARASISTDADHAFASDHIRVGASASVRARIHNVGPMEFGAGANFSIENDTFRELVGLNPLNVTGNLLMDITWVEHNMSNDD